MTGAVPRRPGDAAVAGRRGPASRPGPAPRRPGTRRHGAVLALVLLAVAPAASASVPSFDAVRAAHRPSDLVLADRHGEPLQTLRVDDRVRRLAWVPVQDMSPALLQAIVLSEDRRFWMHSGIDWAAVGASAWANLWNTRTRGASTLTMQLAGLVDEDLARPADGRSLWGKAQQALRARELEATWTKSQILEAYLNAVPLRGELVGIGALSQTLFGKHPSGLDQLEAAITAALVRGPNASPDRVAERACGVLREMRPQAPGTGGTGAPSRASGVSGVSGGSGGSGGSALAATAGVPGASPRRAAAAADPASRLDPCEGVQTRAATALARRGGMPLGAQLAPHFARQWLRRDGPAVQRSTLDAGLQRLAVATLRRQLAELQGRQVEDGAIVVLDNASGEVLAWVGANGGSSAAREVDGVLARRQAGSTLKPFLYGLAFERRLITPASLLDDTPAEIGTGAGLYAPHNYDEGYKGRVSARAALGSSLNVPAVRVGALLPPDALHARLEALGFALPESAGWYGPSLALGSADVTLLALTNAYRALANGGVYSPPALPAAGAGAAPGALVGGRTGGRAGSRATDLAGAGSAVRARPARRVADAAASFLVADILADNNARARTFGLDSALRTRGHVAVKTGTSKDLRDNWCVGFTDRYTVGVWIGNASGAPMHDVSGVSGAAPAWHTLVSALQAGAPSRALAAPPGVRRVALRYAGGEEPPRDEWFVAGTEPAGPVQSLQPGRVFGIRSPTDGSVFALDPDMPPAVQRITFEGEAGSWWLDGRRIGHGASLHWAPWPGRHRLVLRPADGSAEQVVRFEVRGAVARSRPGSQGADADGRPGARAPGTRSAAVGLRAAR